MQRVIESAVVNEKALECNASPFRMDIDDIYIREAMKRGVKIAIGTDAHGPVDLGWIRYGIGIVPERVGHQGCGAQLSMDADSS